MEKHWKPLFLSVAMSGGLYLWLSQLHGWSLHQAEAKTPAGFNNASQIEHDLASGKILSRVIDKVSKNYVDTDRIKPKEMFKASLEYLSKTTPEIMVQVESPDSLLLYVNTQKQSFSTKQITNLTELNYALRDVFSFLVKALPKGANLRDIEYSAINGFLSTLDPHTILLKPDLFADMKANTDGQFGGLGIQIGLRDSTLTVIAPMSGTPAAKEGVKANDKILKIDGESTVNMDTDDAVDRLRGTPGTKVTITLMRKGWTEPRDFTIERAVIKLESVTARTLPDGIGYVKLKNFQKNSFDDLRSALKNFEKDDVTNGLILDLRDNPGGLLEQSIKISDAFLTTGQIVSTVGKQDGQKVREDRPATNSRDEWTSPLIVLINGQSASASEIVSGALKNDNRALIVGTQSFGKGSVQVLYDFPDLSALKLTIAQYLTPGNVSIQGVGIIPDIMLLPATVAPERITYFTSEILTKEADLDAHLTSEFAAKPEEPSVKIHYYIDPKFEETAKKALEEDANAFIEDPEITFARKLLGKAPGKTRSEMLKLSKSFSADFAAEQESKIVEALKAQNIDWTEGKNLSNNGAATATAAFDKNVTTLQAGDETKLTVTVKNTGSRPLYRLRAQTKSDNGYFSEAEMFFGKVEPGQSKSYTIPVKIPKDAISRTDDVVYTFFEDGKSTPEPIKQRVQIKGLERPTFAYGYRISDDEGGNGNGLAEVGESVKFVLTVKNNGKGKSFETVAAIKSYAGKAIQLKDGRTNIDNLAPGEQKTAVFTFDIKAKPEKGSNHLLEISIADLTLREYLGEKILLPIYDNTPKLTEEKIGLSVTTEGANFYSGAIDKSPVISTLAKGSQFIAKGRIGDFYKIVLADGTSGFVKATEAKATTVKAEKVKSKPTLQNSPPVIDLSAFTSTNTNDASIKFEGVVTDESNIHDMYILVNGKKVFYQANSEVSTELKYSAELPLEPGSNTIVVVARENEDVTSQERLIIRRE